MIEPTPVRRVLAGAQVFDGYEMRGAADVALEGSRVAEVGPPGSVDRDFSTVVSLDGLVLAPGFIDIHGMDSSPSNIARKDGANLLLQGVTTIVIGHCGTGRPWHHESSGLPVNVVRLIGHNALRLLAAERFELEDPAALRWLSDNLKNELDHGALGLSLGLMYEPGRSAPIAEIEALTNLVDQAGGLLAAHVRDEGESFLDSLREIIELPGNGRRMVMHLKACGRENWDKLEKGRAMLEAAAVRWTYYPYTDTNTVLRALFPVGLADLAAESLLERLRDPAEQRRVEAQGLQSLAAKGWAGVTITRGKADWLGRSIAALAEEASEPPSVTVARMILEEPSVRARFHDVAELAGLRRSAEHPHALHGSDAYVLDSTDDVEHPRNFGAMAKSLCWRRDGGHLDQGIEMVTSRAADVIGLTDRGRIAPGAIADLVAFDPSRLADRATHNQPGLLSEGVNDVWIAGVRAVSDGAIDDVAQGAVLARTGSEVI